LLYNSDRRNDGNFIITTSEQGYIFNIIDHGFCFGTYWDSQMLIDIQEEWSDAYLPEMYATITSLGDFDSALLAIDSLSDDFFTNLVGQLPAEWLPDQAEKSAMIDFLIAQRDAIETMLANNMQKFVNLIQL